MGGKLVEMVDSVFARKVVVLVVLVVVSPLTNVKIGTLMWAHCASNIKIEKEVVQ